MSSSEENKYWGHHSFIYKYIYKIQPLWRQAPSTLSHSSMDTGNVNFYLWSRSFPVDEMNFIMSLVGWKFLSWVREKQGGLCPISGFLTNSITFISRMEFNKVNKVELDWEKKQAIRLMINIFRRLRICKTFTFYFLQRAFRI